MKRLSTLWSAAILSALLNSPALADVTAFMPNTVTVRYDPFDGQAGLVDIDIELRYDGTQAMPANLIITPDLSGAFQLDGPNTPLSYEIESANGAFTSARYVMPITLQPGNSAGVHTLTFKVPPGQYADAGQSESQLRVELVDAATQAPLLDERAFVLAANVPSRAQTNFAGTVAGYSNGTTHADVDFGVITAGASRTVNFQIRGNSDVNVEISSENGGKMVHDTDDTHVVPYSVVADNIPSDLTSPLTLMRRPERSLAGTSYPLIITIDEVLGSISGRYRDTITVDVYPN